MTYDGQVQSQHVQVGMATYYAQQHQIKEQQTQYYGGQHLHRNSHQGSGGYTKKGNWDKNESQQHGTGVQHSCQPMLRKEMQQNCQQPKMSNTESKQGDPDSGLSKTLARTNDAKTPVTEWSPKSTHASNPSGSLYSEAESLVNTNSMDDFPCLA